MLSLLWVMICMNSNPADADILKGRVERQDEILRLAPPSSGAPAGQVDNQTHSLRISRESLKPLAGAQSPLLDASAFSQTLNGNANDNGFKLGVLKANDFAAPPHKFDIGADRGSREMLLAWERWHHQLSGAIYERWSERADVSGRATLRITVTRDGHIFPTVLTSGGRRFDRGLLDAISSLDGNAGLRFPSKSAREKVTFEADYIAGSNVQPGYSWVKNDVEKVRENY